MLTRNEAAPRDLLRRFTPTPFVADLQVMGRTIRMETNSSTVLEHSQRAFERHAHALSCPSDFLWRVVTETGGGLGPAWPKMTAFSEEGLRLINFGHRSFLAVELDSREAVAFLAEELARDELGFRSVFLSTLFDLTAAALGLTPIPAGCVALDGKGLLIFGPPRSGKTTSSFYAGTLGLEFHCDQVTFLELQGGVLRGWGQFWPAAFRQESKPLLQGRLSSARSFTYSDLTFLCPELSPIQPAAAESVKPAVCVLLERGGAGTPRLTPLSPRDLSELLRGGPPFKDDERFEPQRVKVLDALACTPAYRLAFGSDPCAAAMLFRRLLCAHSPPEAQP